jgi:hypothetical protein
MTELVTVLIPLFTLPLTPLEAYALETCQKHLGDFPITFIKSENLPLSDEVRAICPNADSVSFDPRYFMDRTSFTKLLLSQTLYEQFSWSRYLLILELNVSVTKNELGYWCRQGYDYIQSFPEHDPLPTFLQSIPRRLNPGRYLTLDSGISAAFERSNGVSLRRVKAFERLVKGRKRAINHFLNDFPNPWNDSLFWEYYLNRWRPDLITPNALARRHFARNQASLKLVSELNPLPFSVSALDYIPVQDRHEP